MTTKNTLLISQKTNGRCFFCNKDAEEVDHYIPRSAFYGCEDIMGNPDDVSNLFAACRKCNRSKSDTHPEVFIANKFGLNSYESWSRYERANARILSL